RIAEHGLLNIGDLRDAVSRNNLKLPDLAGPGSFLFGDELLRADRRLGVGMEAVYRRGEVYMRWLQRVSALAFGTPVGRFLTRFVVLPFGIAFAALVFAQEMLHLARVHLHLTPARTLTTVGVLGLFILLLLHVSAFRSGVVRGLTAAGRGLRAVFYD